MVRAAIIGSVATINPSNEKNMVTGEALFKTKEIIPEKRRVIPDRIP